MNAVTPQVKIEVIERSLRCFVLGVCGLLPVIGVPLAIMALAQHQRVKQIAGSQWNPAQRRLRSGALCAWLGIALFLLEVAIYIVVYAERLD